MIGAISAHFVASLDLSKSWFCFASRSLCFASSIGNQIGAVFVPGPKPRSAPLLQPCVTHRILRLSGLMTIFAQSWRNRQSTSSSVALRPPYPRIRSTHQVHASGPCIRSMHHGPWIRLTSLADCPSLTVPKIVRPLRLS
jgi:hypothetical protein